LLSLVVAAKANKNEIEQKTVRIYRIDKNIKIDGFLNEQVWKKPGYSDFTQSDSEDGAVLTEKTTVWLAFDQKAVYVAARLSDSRPNQIIGLLGRRDDFVDSDWFIFSVDPYYDRRSGYQFAVNPIGSICDWTIYNDENTDSTWDGVWKSAARIDDKGWTVEMRIPYDQLRFKQKDTYTWGVNFRGFIKRKNERLWFSWAPKEESGFVSRFAKLEGITGIKPGRHIEILPYSIGKAAFGSEDAGNPFATGKEFSVNAGVDLKVGLKSNLTMDLTFNPDFGQVEVDPAVINLSAAEIYYSEKRPFFIEGANIFRFGQGGSNSNWGADWADPNFFYSRRIGRPPRGTVSSEGYVDYPEWATILTAAKITGKIGKGWNFGFLNALTEREYAQIDLKGNRSSEEVEPFTYYGIMRAQKEYRKGRQGLGFIATSVLRNLRTENLEDTLARNAFGFALDGWTFLDKDRTWVVTGWLGGTKVSGSKTMVLNLQNSYPHYFQRPDATHMEVDESATSMSGWSGRFSINKQKGHFLFNAALGAVSPGFDSTDMGFQWRGDIINGHIMAGYRVLKPWKILRSWNIFLLTQRNYDFGGSKIGEQRVIFIGNAEFLNYWTLYGQFSYNPERWSNMLTRGGPLSLQLTRTWGEFGIHSDDRKKWVFELAGYYSTEKSGSDTKLIRCGIRWKPGSNFNIGIFPDYTLGNNVAQWVTNVEDGLMTETYGTRHIFADIKQDTLSCSIHINWIFSPKLSLQGYIQPFIAVGAYKGFKELARPKSFDFNRFGENNSSITYEDGSYNIDPDGPEAATSFSFSNPDFNYKSLRGTIVLRWEYRPGSTLYAVWTQNRADYADPGNFRFGRDFSNLFSAPGDDIFMIKFTYRFKM
ncbi:DUF5916 domain-containing protein, partial [Acidobacteriota bacterium]